MSGVTLFVLRAEELMALVHDQVDRAADQAYALMHGTCSCPCRNSEKTKHVPAGSVWRACRICTGFEKSF